VNGKGDGVVAAELKTAPSDLTQIARRNGGRFDGPKMIGIIDGRQSVPAHGPREMPVWGFVFDAELQDQPYTGYTVLLRARVLSDYLETIQEK